MGKSILSQEATTGKRDLAWTGILLAEAEAALGHYDQALAHLEKAEGRYQAIDAQSALLELYVRRAAILIKAGEYAKAGDSIRQGTLSEDKYVQARSAIARGLIALKQGNANEAALECTQAFFLCRQIQIESLSYEMQYLLGQVRESQGQPDKALRH